MLGKSEIIMKLMFIKTNNDPNEHEAKKSEDTNEEEDTECIFCRETLLNSANGEILALCMSRSKWACKGVLYLTL